MPKSLAKRNFCWPSVDLIIGLVNGKIGPIVNCHLSLSEHPWRKASRATPNSIATLHVASGVLCISSCHYVFVFVLVPGLNIRFMHACTLLITLIAPLFCLRTIFTRSTEHEPKQHEPKHVESNAAKVVNSSCAKANQCRGPSRFSGRFGVFALGSSAYPNFCAYGKYLDIVLAELGGERVTRLGIGDELCGQEQSFNEWTTQVFGQACDVFCLTDDLDMNEVMKRAMLKPLLWSKESVRLEENVPTIELKEQQKTKRIEQGEHLDYISAFECKLTNKSMPQTALSKLSNNKKVMNYKLLEREFLHEDGKSNCEANLRQTIRVSLQTDLNQSHNEAKEEDRSAAYYLPGDHLAVYPENEDSLVSALINRLSESYGNSVSADKPYMIKIRSQHSMDNGLTNGHNGDDQLWSLHDRLPAPVSLREAMTRFLDITTPPTQQFLTLLADTAENTKDSERMKHLAKDSSDYETWKAKFYPNFLEVVISKLLTKTNQFFVSIRCSTSFLQPNHRWSSSLHSCHFCNLVTTQFRPRHCPTPPTSGGGAVHHGQWRTSQWSVLQLFKEHSSERQCVWFHPKRTQLPPPKRTRCANHHGGSRHRYSPLSSLLATSDWDERTQ